MKMKAEIREMKALLESNDRREKELSLRQIPTEETEKTKRLLSRLQSNSIGD